MPPPGGPYARHCPKQGPVSRRFGAPCSKQRYLRDPEIPGAISGSPLPLKGRKGARGGPEGGGGRR
eukprot:1455213-Rhodomonas_salina.1